MRRIEGAVRACDGAVGKQEVVGRVHLPRKARLSRVTIMP